MSDAVIGIISYLPDNVVIRKNRYLKLLNLIKQCNYIFNDLPIIIISQNWNTEELNDISQYTNIKLYKYDKLGIVGARNTLRKHFLESNYNYLIMLDDDITLYGGPEQGQEYLNQLNMYKDGFWEFNLTLLKLFAISKSLYEKEKFDDDLNPENGDGFEDRIFVNKLRTKYPELKHIFNVNGLSQSSISTKDTDSTWYNGQDIQSMREKTNKIISNMTTKFNERIE